MGLIDNFAKLTKMLLDNQQQFYRENARIDDKYLKRYKHIMDDEESGATDHDQSGPELPLAQDGGEARTNPGGNQPAP